MSLVIKLAILVLLFGVRMCMTINDVDTMI